MGSLYSMPSCPYSAIDFTLVSILLFVCLIFCTLTKCVFPFQTNLCPVVYCFNENEEKKQKLIIKFTINSSHKMYTTNLEHNLHPMYALTFALVNCFQAFE